jgi:hypothetical protein
MLTAQHGESKGLPCNFGQAFDPVEFGREMALLQTPPLKKKAGKK